MLIAQLSDTHLQTGPLAAEPARLLHRALGSVLSLDLRPDCVVITGDIANDGRDEEYTALVQILERFPLPVHLLPGNHDEPATMIARFGGSGYLGGGAAAHYFLDYPGTRLIALDTHVPGQPGGHLGAEQLAWLDRTLRGSTGPAVIALHHPPIPVGLPFLDGMSLNNPADLAAVTARHPQVALILAGHAHRVVFGQFDVVPVAVAPSTYRQAALDLRAGPPTGYRHESTGFLLHRIERAGVVTHYVPTGSDGGTVGYF